MWVSAGYRRGGRPDRPAARCRFSYSPGRGGKTLVSPASWYACTASRVCGPMRASAPTMHGFAFPLQGSISGSTRSLAKSPFKPKRESPVRLPFWKGRRRLRMWSFRGSYANPGSGTQQAWKGRRRLRMWSFRGSYANPGSGTQQASSDVVPVAGLEPARDRSQGILSPRCLPFHHTGIFLYSTTRRNFRQAAARCKSGRARKKTSGMCRLFF